MNERVQALFRQFTPISNTMRMIWGLKFITLYAGFFMRVFTFGVVTLGLLPPMAPGKMDPVS